MRGNAVADNKLPFKCFTPGCEVKHAYKIHLCKILKKYIEMNLIGSKTMHMFAVSHLIRFWNAYPSVHCSV